MESKEIRRLANRFRTRYKLRQIDFKGLKKAVQEQGYTVIEFGTCENDEDISLIIEKLDLGGYIERLRGFTYSDPDTDLAVEDGKVIFTPITDGYQEGLREIVGETGGTGNTGSSSAGSGAAYHTVTAGETLWSISLRYGTTVEALVNLNPQLKNPNLIFWGQIYVVLLEDYRMVKYVRKHENPNRVILRSENKEYDDIEIEKRDICDLFIVENIIRIDNRI